MSSSLRLPVDRRGGGGDAGQPGRRVVPADAVPGVDDADAAAQPGDGVRTVRAAQRRGILDVVDARRSGARSSVVGTLTRDRVSGGVQVLPERRPAATSPSRQAARSAVEWRASCSAQRV